MKLKPVVDALEERGVEVSIVHTGQHYDPEMSDVFFEDLGIRRPDEWLDVGSGSHAEQTAKIMVGFEPIVATRNPDVVIVVGDVNSTVACALVAAKSGSLVAHVEAGLRSRDWAMPEEINRIATDRLSDYLFAPSEDAAENLRREGYREDQIHLVGNVMVDTLLSNLTRAKDRDVLGRLGLTGGDYGLVTLHRPSNVDDPSVFTRIMHALKEISSEIPLVFPAHPRTRVRLEDIEVGGHIKITPPVGYLDCIALEASARLVLTDSGGIQEETTVLGVPCLTIRENTERPVTVTHGTNTVVGTDFERIVATARSVLTKGASPKRPELWDGRAAERIADAILAGGSPSERLRPSELDASL